MYQNQGYRPPSYQPPQGQYPSRQPRMPASPSPRPPAPRRKYRKKAVAVLLLLLALALVILGLTVYSRYREQQAEYQAIAQEVGAVQNVFAPNIYVDGIALGGMSAQEGIDAVLAAVNARQNSWQLSLTYQGHTFYTLTNDTLGIQTDIAQVYSLLEGLYQIGKTGTLAENKQALDTLKAEPRHAYTTQSEMTEHALDSILSQIQAQLTYPATDAYVAYFYPDLEDPFIIQPEGYGSSLDVAALKAEILERAATGQSGSLEITPDSIAPRVTAADIRSQVSLMYKAVTPVSSSSTADRTSNIRTAFSRLNGQIVEPGDTLSFNKVTLNRTLKNGYKYAIEYDSGLETMGIGGGVCQASTTLYLAAVQSGLEIVERESHADPVSYTVFGQDATVVYGQTDFVFRNTSGGRIYITAHVENVKKNSYQCVIRIFGPSLGDTTYKLRTAQVETIAAPLTVSYQEDKEHQYVTYRDEEPYLIRKARDGYICETYLQRYVGGQLVEETLVSRDTCKARAAVYLTGTLNRSN